MNILEKCTLCPRNCKVNRLNGNIGRCKAGAKIKIAASDLHFYEEPCISGKEGSGTVFFSGCNLSCIFCQNYKISQECGGDEIEIQELANRFLELQKRGANNINLVTGFMFVPQIIEALKIAKSKGLIIPIVYNTSGYESLETLKMLEGYIDIYLPDLKYAYNDLAEKLSDVKDYFEVTKIALKEMKRQVGNEMIFDDRGMLKRGMIIRHLVLPNHIQNSKKALKWIRENLGKDTYVSVMAQYFPCYKAKEDEDIGRKITQEEYDEIAEYYYSLGLHNGYMQDIEEIEEKYVPKFNI